MQFEQLVKATSVRYICYGLVVQLRQISWPCPDFADLLCRLWIRSPTCECCNKSNQRGLSLRIRVDLISPTRAIGGAGDGVACCLKCACI